MFIPMIAMPDFYGQGVSQFNGRNILKFIKDYKDIYWMYYVEKKHRLVYFFNYCEKMYAEAI